MWNVNAEMVRVPIFRYESRYCMSAKFRHTQFQSINGSQMEDMIIL